MTKGIIMIQTCEICNEPISKNIHTLNGMNVCHSCYASLHKYLEGTIDPDSLTGFQIKMKHVVSDVLGDCRIISLPKYPYTLYSDLLGIISIKTSKLSNNKWLFDRGSFKLAPDTYIFVCLTSDKTSIEHVYIIPENASIFPKSGLTITNSDIGLERFEEFEVESDIFNAIYQNINLEELPEFRNFYKTEQIKITGNVLTAPSTI